MAIYQGASDRSRGLPIIGGLLRLPGIDPSANPRASSRPRGPADDRPVAGRRPPAGRRTSSSVSSASARATAGARSAGARPSRGARPAAPVVRTAAPAARSTPAVRPVVLHHGRALPRNAALVGRRTIAVAVHRPRTAALGIAAVASVLLAVLFYLSQNFQVAAARYELDTLATERAALLQELRTQEGAVTQAGSVSKVVTWAQDADLEELGRARSLGAR